LQFFPFPTSKGKERHLLHLESELQSFRKEAAHSLPDSINSWINDLSKRKDLTDYAVL